MTNSGSSEAGSASQPWRQCCVDALACQRDACDLAAGIVSFVRTECRIALHPVRAVRRTPVLSGLLLHGAALVPPMEQEVGRDRDGQQCHRQVLNEL